MNKGYIIIAALTAASCSSGPEKVVLDNGAHFYDVETPAQLLSIKPNFGCAAESDIKFDGAGFAICSTRKGVNVELDCPAGTACSHTSYGFEGGRLSYVTHTINEADWVGLSSVSAEAFGDPKTKEQKFKAGEFTAAVVISEQEWKLDGFAYSLTVITNHDNQGWVESESYISSISW
ncbi:hypothetical protein [Alcanivorax sp.]|uniref:hypothetical protein n=1 Tax=Alcanivorax sp. TaxID=1872427 RepID=UPI0025BBA847|nr:hypothetical protein [Alcanivorax sp.]